MLHVSYSHMHKCKARQNSAARASTSGCVSHFRPPRSRRFAKLCKVGLALLLKQRQTPTKGHPSAWAFVTLAKTDVVGQPTLNLELQTSTLFSLDYIDGRYFRSKSGDPQGALFGFFLGFSPLL